MSNRPLAASAVVALASLLAAQSPLPAPQPLEGLLPASTYAAARFAGLEACRASVQRSSLADLIGNFVGQLPAEVRREHLERGLDEAGEHVRHALQEIGLSPADVRAVLGQPMLVGLGRVTVEGMGPSVALMIERGEHGEAIDRCVSTLVHQLPRLGVDVHTEAVTIEGHALQRVQAEQGPPLFFGPIGSAFCISNSRGYLTEVARVAAGQERGLAREPRLAPLRQLQPSQSLAAWLVNLESVMTSLAPHLPYEAADFADALGLGRLDHVYWAASGDKELLHVGVGGSEQGLMKALVAAPVDLSFASACSSNTVLFGAGSFDVPGVIDAFQRFTRLLPEQAQEEIQRNLARELGRDLRRAGTSAAEVDALLRAFGGQLGFALSLEKGAVPKPELLLHLSVADRGPVQALLQRFEAMTEQRAHLEWATRKVGEHEVRFCSVPLPEAEFQLSPCYALEDGHLWLASDTAALTRALRRGDDASVGLTAEEDFQKVQKRAQGHSGVVHLRAFRAVEIGWRTVETMVYPMLDSHADELGFDSSALPDTEQLAEALGATTTYYRVDDDGLTVRSEGTFVIGGLLAALGLAGDEVLQRASGKVY
ncbi:MAG: hypothetical protein H6835_00700 [Planctomycetes bacterium]|nr:hypothetical protein [Planctomycetota bacterium]